MKNDKKNALEMNDECTVSTLYRQNTETNVFHLRFKKKQRCNRWNTYDVCEYQLTLFVTCFVKVVIDVFGRHDMLTQCQ